MHELGGGGARSAPYKSQPEPPVGCALRTKVFDCAPAPWQLGTTSYQSLAGGGLLLTHMRNGFGLLFEHEVGGGARQLANDIPAVAGWLSTAASSIALLTGGEQPLLGTQLSRPQSLYFRVAQRNGTDLRTLFLGCIALPNQSSRLARLLQK